MVELKQFTTQQIKEKKSNLIELLSYYIGRGEGGRLVDNLLG